MNFLEQLVAEWYSYKGYFVQTNVKFGPLKHGGYEGEMDVVAFHPKDKVLVHVETSTDSRSWEKRRYHFESKFRRAQKHYSELFHFDYDAVEKIAIVGLRSIAPDGISFGKDVVIKTGPEFIREMAEYFKDKSPLKQAVPEHWPLIRLLQISAFYRGK
jgi:Holliday junction resolvase-like predicted endonuclease